MDTLRTLSNTLVNSVRLAASDEEKRMLIVDHIKGIPDDRLMAVEFPSGVVSEWFNVQRAISEEDLLGKIVVLDFFTYCCINCLHLLPYLKKIEEKFTIEDGVVIIGIHSGKFTNEKNPSNVALALKKLNISHPVVNDAGGSMWNKLSVTCWPTVVILEPSGKPLLIFSGERIKDELLFYVETILNLYPHKISHHSLPTCELEDVLSYSVLRFPTKIARFDDVFALSDTGNNRILVIDQTGTVIYRIGGKSKGYQDGTLAEAKFNTPQGVAFYNKDLIYVADTGNHAIRLIDLDQFQVKTVVGTGQQGTTFEGGDASWNISINSPWDLCLIASRHAKTARGKGRFVPWEGSRDHKRLCGPQHTKRSSESKPVRMFYGSQDHHGNSGSPVPPPPPPPPPPSFYLPPKTVYRPNEMPRSIFLEEEEPKTPERIPPNVLIIAMSGYHQIWALFLEDTVWWNGLEYKKNYCTPIAGCGREESRNNTYPLLSGFAQPSGLAYSDVSKCIFVADSESSSIRKISLRDGAVSLVAGGDRNPTNLFNFGDVDGRGMEAKFQHPMGLAFSVKTNVLYVCDSYNNKLKRIKLPICECTSADGNIMPLEEPNGCVLDEKEEVLYITDTNNHRIVAYDLRQKIMTDFEIKEHNWDPFDIEWNLDVEMNNNGGILKLSVNLEPMNITGNWNFELRNTNFVSKSLTGEISSFPLKYELKILPSNRDLKDTAQLIFHLIYCGHDICTVKKCLLTISIHRNENANDVKEIEIQKMIIP